MKKKLSSSLAPDLAIDALVVGCKQAIDEFVRERLLREEFEDHAHLWREFVAFIVAKLGEGRKRRCNVRK